MIIQMDNLFLVHLLDTFILFLFLFLSLEILIIFIFVLVDVYSIEISFKPTKKNHEFVTFVSFGISIKSIFDVIHWPISSTKMIEERMPHVIFLSKDKTVTITRIN
jgi:hypothetical protein